MFGKLLDIFVGPKETKRRKVTAVATGAAAVATGATAVFAPEQLNNIAAAFALIFAP